MQFQRRPLTGRGAFLGLTVPLSSLVLCGLAEAQLGAPQRIYGPTVRGGHLAAVDLDTDGRVDLATFGVEVGWYRNLGGGVFAPALQVLAAPLAFPVNQFAYAAADGDADGDADLYVGGARQVPNSAESRWFLRRVENLGGGGFARAVVVASVGFEVAGMALADLDGDGVLDLVTTQNGRAGVAADVGWQRGLGATSFAARVSLAQVADAASLRAADLDGDGDQDLLVASAGATLVALQNVGGAFTALATLDASSLVGDATHPDVADLDGDGDLDVLLGGTQAGTVWFERVGGAYAAPRAIGTPESDENTVQALTAGETIAADLDADGDLDVVSGRFDGFVFGPSFPLRLVREPRRRRLRGCAGAATLVCGDL